MTSADSQTFTYTPAHRLASASGGYGSYAWTYDAVGNRTSEQLGATLSTYAYPSTSNRLSSIATGAATRSFTSDAAGAVATDSRGAGPALTCAYDEEGRLAQATQTATPANGATYAYDARWRLSSRTVTQSGAPAATTFYVYDLADHLIAEVDASGQTRKEYIWLDDLPVAVVDQVASANPAIYYVAVDHLMRPLRLMAQDGTRVWQAKYAPFGATTFLYANPVTLDARFPGQWFQLETGLAYNWHRHYDASTGRYVQPDPLVVDDGEGAVGGVAENAVDPSMRRGKRGLASFVPSTVNYALPFSPVSRNLMPDGPSLYNYVGGSPLSLRDPSGLGIGEWLSNHLTNACPRPVEPKCQPCEPPPSGGAQCFEPNSGHTHNGWDPHYHIWTRNQNPISCQCFWNRGSGPTGTTEFPSSTMQSCYSYPSWPAQ